MGLDEGEWIHDEGWRPNEGTGPAGDEEPAAEWPAGPEPPTAGKRRGDRSTGGFSVRLAAAVAVVAAAAGVTAALFLTKEAPTATAAAATPSASASAGSGAGLPALPGLSGRGDGQLQMMLIGKVLAVSGTSITIGGDGPSVTAAVTRSTEITGEVHGIGGVKVGTEISAQLTGTARHLTATAIQDPASTS